jgi:molecular chaperone DnaK
MSADLLDRTRFTTANLVQEAGLTWSELTRVLIVGGSSRMPMVQRMLEDESGKTPDQSLSADEAVAHGAAVYAGFVLDSQTGERPKLSVQNVNGHNLGVLGVEKATGRPRTRVMIPRNTKLPTSKAAPFVTHRDNQQSVVVRVVEGGDASGNDATHIGKCVIRDLPAGLPAGSPVEVVFQYGDDGRLKIKAHIPHLGQGAISEIERASGLTAETLQEWNRRIQSSESLFAVGSRDDEPPPLPLGDAGGPPPIPAADDDEPPPVPGFADDEPPPIPG